MLGQASPGYVKFGQFISLHLSLFQVKSG